jgi:hypothetical protein
MPSLEASHFTFYIPCQASYCMHLTNNRNTCINDNLMLNDTIELRHLRKLFRWSAVMKSFIYQTCRNSNICRWNSVEQTNFVECFVKMALCQYFDCRTCVHRNGIWILVFKFSYPFQRTWNVMWYANKEVEVRFKITWMQTVCKSWEKT